MHIHILGICGTFMAGVAAIAKEKGFSVTGSDQNVYPPMSTLLADMGIEITQGYEADSVPETPDLFVIGNAMKRGMPIVEQVLNSFTPYMSGPAFLAEHVLQERWVLAVAGTHGKTTTSSMLAWILEDAGFDPGFLIGGLPRNFDVSARLGGGSFFVIEADEYDSAFFDKRSKFVHYHPRTLILNNCEFDHADIFDDLNAIKRQFHHLVRTVPGIGLIVENESDANVRDILEMGAWTERGTFAGSGDWQGDDIEADSSAFVVKHKGKEQGTVTWDLIGAHNRNNAIAAIAAARHVGVRPADAIAALAHFKSVKRRLEVRGTPNGITVYDDFAHHPTAIATTLSGLKARVKTGRLIGVLECGSYTMRNGVHNTTIKAALDDADFVYCKTPASSDWSLKDALSSREKTHRHFDDIHVMIDDICKEAAPGDHLVVMSNTGFAGLHDKLLVALERS